MLDLEFFVWLEAVDVGKVLCFNYLPYHTLLNLLFAVLIVYLPQSCAEFVWFAYYVLSDLRLENEILSSQLINVYDYQFGSHL